MTQLSEKAADRFWAKVQKTDGCWSWTGAQFRRGYGAFQLGGSTRKAHRIAYELEHGPIPAGLYVCHRCDNPSCVRPDHLFLGTAADNNTDRSQKGRTKPGRNTGGYKLVPGANAGERNPRAKMTWQSVSDLRHRYASGHELLKDLAREYGIAFSTADKIVCHETWRERK